MYSHQVDSGDSNGKIKKNIDIIRWRILRASQPRKHIRSDGKYKINKM